MPLNRESSHRLPRLALLALLASPGALAQFDSDLIESVRAELVQEFDLSSAGTLYASTVNFAVNPDIAAAYFTLDDASGDGVPDPELENTRLPLRHEWELKESRVRPFVQGVAGSLNLEATFPLLPEGNEFVTTTWRTRGFSVGAGVEIPIDEAWTLIGALDLGVADVSNKAAYSGPIGQQLFAPVLQNFLFDWDSRASVAGVTLGGRYKQQLTRFRLLGHATGSINQVKSFDESSPLVAFDASVSTFDWELNSVHPLPLEPASVPVDLVTIIGGTHFIGSGNGALGFDGFWEAGLALQFDFQDRTWAIDGLRLGVTTIFGNGVSGWSLVMGRPL